MEGVPFVGNDACAHNLLPKGRPLIMRFRQLRCKDGSKTCAHRNLRRKFHLRRALSNGIFLVVAFINVVERDNEARGFVVSKSPCAHILYSLLGEDRMAGQELYIRYLVAVSRDFQLNHALQAHRLGFRRVFWTLEGCHRWEGCLGLTKGTTCKNAQRHSHEQ
jgi:hypothetical protein